MIYPTRNNHLPLLRCCLLLPSLFSMVLNTHGKDDKDKLPLAAGVALEQLDKWEEQQRKKLADAIAAKRKEVVVVLERQLEKATRDGDLESAKAIRKAIADLKASSAGGAHGWSTATLNGTVWDGEKTVWTLREGGVLEAKSKSSGTKSAKSRWRLRPDGVLEFQWKDKTKVDVIFDPGGKAAHWKGSSSIRRIKLVEK